MTIFLKFTAAVIVYVTMAVGTNAMADEVNVYSARIEKLVKPAFEAFQARTGIKVNLLTGSEAALIERLKAEGRLSPADILLTVDAGNLWLAQNEGLLQPVSSETLEANVPASLRDPEGYWFGLTVRARTIVYSKERVDALELANYEGLGNPKWRGRLCLRTSKKVYNKSLVATMIAAIGAEKTEMTLEGWMRNDPIIHDSDGHLLQGIAEGQCDLGLVNTYYLGRKLAENPDYPVGLFWANQEDRGTHVNISGAGIVKNSRNVENGIQLLEFLSSPEAQNLFADDNMEYPVNPAVAPSDLLVDWWGSDFKRDSVNVATAGKLQAQAVKMMARVGYQ